MNHLLMLVSLFKVWVYIFGYPDFAVSEETDGVCEDPNSSTEWVLLEQDVLRNHPAPGILFLSHLARFHRSLPELLRALYLVCPWKSSWLCVRRILCSPGVCFGVNKQHLHIPWNNSFLVFLYDIFFRSTEGFKDEIGLISKHGMGGVSQKLYNNQLECVKNQVKL